MVVYRTYKGIIGIGMLCLLFTACGEKKSSSKNKGITKRAAPHLDAYIVKTEPYSARVEVPGSVVANEVTEIHPEVSGRVVQLHITEGAVVSSGALLAKIYDGDLQAQLRKLQSQLAIAKSNEERASQLLQIQGISKNDYDASLLNLNNIRADIDVVKTEISRTEVRAPFSGKIGLKNISPGAYVTPATVIAAINQVSDLKLDFSIPEKYISDITNGQNVDFTVQGNNQVYHATVYATQSNVQLENRSLVVRARVTGKKEGLVPGAFAKVRIDFSPDANAIFVPSQSVIPTIKGKQVVLYKTGKAFFADVEVGARDSARVEVTRGLKVGDTVLTSGVMSLNPDDKINIGKLVK
ncbi:MAG: efflux RND transporter periplasmic adaptor subunit [Niabella sp.]